MPALRLHAVPNAALLQYTPYGVVDSGAVFFYLHVLQTQLIFRHVSYNDAPAFSAPTGNSLCGTTSLLPDLKFVFRFRRMTFFNYTSASRIVAGMERGTHFSLWSGAAPCTKQAVSKVLLSEHSAAEAPVPSVQLPATRRCVLQSSVNLGGYIVSVEPRMAMYSIYSRPHQHRHQ